MKSLRRVAPFPWRRLRRLPAVAAQIYPRPQPNTEKALEKVVARLATRFGFETPHLSFERQEVLARQQLREDLPGQWYFALLVDPLGGRQGYLALDPLLCSLLAQKAESEARCLHGWWGQLIGLNGLVGLVVALALEELENLNEAPDWCRWRYGGLVPSTGELGRGVPPDRCFFVSWWKISWPHRVAFAGWLEPENSVKSTSKALPEVFSLPRDLTVCGRMEIGTVCLQADVLATLRHGDVLLLQEGQPSSLVFGNFRFSLKNHQRGFEIVGLEESPGGMDMAEVNISAVREAKMDPEKLSRLPVELRVEAGRVNLRLEQVMTLKAGDVLTVSEKVLGPVDVLAGERLIARGELVDVEGRRGVRLLQVFLDWEQKNEGQA